MSDARKMVDSGVEWIGEIPEGWRIEILGSFTSLTSGKGISSELVELEPSKDRNVPLMGSNGIRGYVSKATHKGPKWLIGRQGSAGTVNLATGGFYPSEHALVANETGKADHAYLGYSMMAADFPQYIGGTAQPGLAASFLLKIPMPFPPIREQQSIASFLNQHTSLIDQERALISAKIQLLREQRKATIFECVTGKRTIVETQYLAGLDDWSDVVCAGHLAAVPTAGKDDPFVKSGRLVDSGVEWIGEIPEGWNVKRMKDVSLINPKINLPKNGRVSFIPMERLHFGTHDLSETRSLPEAGSYTKFSNGDLLIAKVTPCFENGKIAIAENLHGGLGLGSSEIVPIRPTGIHPKYLMYTMQSQPFIAAGCATMNGTAGLQRVSTSFWVDTEVAFPNDIEQQSIASFLDHYTSSIDQEISLLETRNELLGEKRKALIFEAVTGKLDIHGYTP